MLVLLLGKLLLLLLLQLTKLGETFLTFSLFLSPLQTWKGWQNVPIIYFLVWEI